MNIIVVYGCPCSGKSTYAAARMGEDDLVYDYDALARAMTCTNGHRLEKSTVHGLILEMRARLIQLAKEREQGNLYLLTCRAGESLMKLMEDAGVPAVEYKFIDCSYDETMQHLEGDESREDKEGWKKIIDEWFREYKTETRSMGMREIRIAEIRAGHKLSPLETESLVLTGMPIVFDTPVTIHDPAGEYTEVIKRGALDGADLSDVSLLYNHDLNKVPLARTPKTMRLTVGLPGLSFYAALPPTGEARAVYEAVKRGDLTGMSFAFKVPEGGDIWDPHTNTRTIIKIEKVFECSIVPFPAYPTTSVEARNAQGSSLKNLEKKRQAKILYNQIMKERI